MRAGGRRAGLGPWGKQGGQKGRNQQAEPAPGPRSLASHPRHPPSTPRAQSIVASHSQPEPASSSLSLGMAWRTRLTTSSLSLLVRKGNSPLEPCTTKPDEQPGYWCYTHTGSYLPNTIALRVSPSHLCPEAGRMFQPAAVTVSTPFFFVLMKCVSYTPKNR